MQIIGDPIGTVEVKVLTNQTHMYKLGRVQCDRWPQIFAPDENLGDKRWLFVYFSLLRLDQMSFAHKVVLWVMQQWGYLVTVIGLGFFPLTS